MVSCTFPCELPVVADYPPFLGEFEKRLSWAWNDLAEGKKPPKIEGFH